MNVTLNLLKFYINNYIDRKSTKTNKRDECVLRSLKCYFIFQINGLVQG